jgi:hypothetical protein
MCTFTPSLATAPRHLLFPNTQYLLVPSPASVHLAINVVKTKRGYRRKPTNKDNSSRREQARESKAPLLIQEGDSAFAPQGVTDFVRDRRRKL